MKGFLTVLFLAFCAASFGQAIEKRTTVPFSKYVPTTRPQINADPEIWFNVSNGVLYKFNRARLVWEVYAQGITAISGDVPPAYTGYENEMVINGLNEIYRYQNGSWVLVNGGGSGGGDGSETKINAGSGILVSGIGTTGNPYVISATGGLPSQTGNSGKFLKTDGSNASWETTPLTFYAVDGSFASDRFVDGNSKYLQFTGLNGYYLETNSTFGLDLVSGGDASLTSNGGSVSIETGAAGGIDIRAGVGNDIVLRKTSLGEIRLKPFGASSTVGQVWTATDGNGAGNWQTPASGGGDDWGSQVAETDATLSGDGTSGSPLKLAQQGATDNNVLTWDGSDWSPAEVPVQSPELEINGAGRVEFSQQGATNGQVLVWNGTNAWTPSDIPTQSPELAINGGKIELVQQGAVLGQFLRWDGTNAWTPGDVQVGQSVSYSGRVLSLVNDSSTPGNSKYYGTNGSGTKGFHDLPSGGGGVSINTLTKSADQNVTGTTATVLSGLTSAITSGQKVNFQAVVKYSTPGTTTGISLSVNAPATNVNYSVIIPSTATQNKFGATETPNTAIISSNSPSAAFHYATITGYFTATSNGDLEIKGASSNGGTVTFKEFSTLNITK